QRLCFAESEALGWSDAGCAPHELRGALELVVGAGLPYRLNETDPQSAALQGPYQAQADGGKPYTGTRWYHEQCTGLRHRRWVPARPWALFGRVRRRDLASLGQHKVGEALSGHRQGRLSAT